MKKERKIIDLIIILILTAVVVVMVYFTLTRETGNQEVILMEIYKCAGPQTSTDEMEHYYIYQNTTTIKIRNSSKDGSNNTISKEVSQDLITSLQNSLDEYISQNPTMNTGFNINERYTIEYSGKTVVVPNPSVASLLGYDSNEYSFYHIVENYINNIK